MNWFGVKMYFVSVHQFQTFFCVATGCESSDVVCQKLRWGIYMNPLSFQFNNLSKYRTLYNWPQWNKNEYWKKSHLFQADFRRFVHKRHILQDEKAEKKIKRINIVKFFFTNSSVQFVLQVNAFCWEFYLWKNANDSKLVDIDECGKEHNIFQTAHLFRSPCFWPTVEEDPHIVRFEEMRYIYTQMHPYL